jgi:hypothetical protein
MNPYGSGRTCGLRVKHGACTLVRAHRSDQRAPADHSERREQVTCTRREKPETGLAPKTREEIVVCQLAI